MSRNGTSSIDKDLLVIDTKLEMLRAQEAQYDALIRQFEDLKSRATREKETLEREAQDLEAMRLPINWVPNEILGQIFAFYVEKESQEAAISGPPSVAPLTLSHVNRRWRAVALSTPEVWSYIHLRGPWNEDWVRVSLERAHCSALSVYYDSTEELETPEDLEQVTSFLNLLGAKLYGLKRLEVAVKSPEAISPFVQALNNTATRFRALGSLSLSITGPDPQFSSQDGLLTNKHNLPDQLHTIPRTLTSIGSNLTHLKLEKLPPSNLPYHLIANLISLELNYPPRKARPTDGQYSLRLSALLRFLAHTPRLEELSLNNTNPIFDVSLPDDDAPSNPTLKQIPPVRLAHLKVFNWSIPFSGDVHQLMSHIEAHSLEKLDVWVASKPEPSWRQSLRSQTTRLAVIDFPVLEDLTFQCATDDSALASLRKFTFPSLQRLDIVNTTVPTDNKKRTTESLRSFPRVETIFRDPRLLCLTHLTLSHFEFSDELGRSEGVLGYMPALISLSLEACLGAANLIKVLGESYTIRLSGFNRRQTQQRPGQRGVRVCPRLEALAFWGCDDLTLHSLYRIVLARNGDVNGTESGDLKASLQTSQGNPHPAQGPLTGPITGSEHAARGAAVGASNRNPDTTPTRVMGRWIKPLRRAAARQPQGGASSGGAGDSPAPIAETPSSSASMAHEVLPPSPIVYTRIHNCPLISESDASLLRDAGVADVVWIGDE